MSPKSTEQLRSLVVWNLLVWFSICIDLLFVFVSFVIAGTSCSNFVQTAVISLFFRQKDKFRVQMKNFLKNLRLLTLCAL